MIKRSIYQEDATILNLYAPNKKVSLYIKQTLKGEIDKCTAVIGDFDTPFSVVDRLS